MRWLRFYFRQEVKIVMWCISRWVRGRCTMSTDMIICLKSMTWSTGLWYIVSDSLVFRWPNIHGWGKEIFICTSHPFFPIQNRIWVTSWENQQFALVKTKMQISFEVTAMLIYQHLCFCYTDSTIPLLSKSKISSLYLSSGLVQLGLCRTCLDTTLLVFSWGGSFFMNAIFAIWGVWTNT